MHWHDHAACRDEDPELFFPTSSSGPDHDRQVAMAKAVCERCEVRTACLEEAVRRQVRDGIWGGMTDTERRRLSLAHVARRRMLV